MAREKMFSAWDLFDRTMKIKLEHGIEAMHREAGNGKLETTIEVPKTLPGSTAEGAFVGMASVWLRELGFVVEEVAPEALPSDMTLEAVRLLSQTARLRVSWNTSGSTPPHIVHEEEQ